MTCPERCFTPCSSSHSRCAARASGFPETPHYGRQPSPRAIACHEGPIGRRPIPRPPPESPPHDAYPLSAPPVARRSELLELIIIALIALEVGWGSQFAGIPAPLARWLARARSITACRPASRGTNRRTATPRPCRCPADSRAAPRANGPAGSARPSRRPSLATLPRWDSRDPRAPRSSRCAARSDRALAAAHRGRSRTAASAGRRSVPPRLRACATDSHAGRSS